MQWYSSKMRIVVLQRQSCMTSKVVGSDGVALKISMVVATECDVVRKYKLRDKGRNGCSGCLAFDVLHCF